MSYNVLPGAAGDPRSVWALVHGTTCSICMATTVINNAYTTHKCFKAIVSTLHNTNTTNSCFALTLYKVASAKDYGCNSIKNFNRD